MNELIITEYNGKRIAADFTDQKMVLASVIKDREPVRLGNIYVARVDNIVKNINAAFVNITPEISCYLDLTKAEGKIIYTKKQSERQLSMGDEILVQVVKERVKTKAPVVCADFSLAGKFVSLVNGSNGVFVSKKIVDQNIRKNLIELLSNFASDSFGIIARTNSESASSEEILTEVQELVSKYEQLVKTAEHSVRYTLLSEELPDYIVRIRDAKEYRYDRILTDIPEIYEELKVFCQKLPVRNADGDLVSVDFVKEKDTLNIIYKTGRFMELATRRIINLKSGASLYIDPTEALTAIDVNTGKAIAGKKTSQQTFFDINKEAAEEIAYQLKLRNISGMILIDFINMEDFEMQDKLIGYLKELISKDSVQTEFVDITKLGLVELTRRKVLKSLAEQLV